MRKPLALIALVSYLIVLITTSLWPKPVDGEGLLATITREVLRFTSSYDSLKWIQYNQLEAIANVLLYVPLGIFLVMFWPKAKIWLLALIPALISLLVEGSQRLFLPDRYATLNDVLSNALGGVLGIVIAASIRRMMKSSK
ncbi:MAG: VanZ family protein [Rhodoluna sp.]